MIGLVGKHYVGGTKRICLALPTTHDLAVASPPFSVAIHVNPFVQMLCQKNMADMPFNNLCTLRVLRHHLYEVKYERIYIFGRSIGTGPAVQLASQFPIGGLILVSPFTSIKASLALDTCGCI